MTTKKPNTILEDKIEQDGEEAILFPESMPEVYITIGRGRPQDFRILPLPDDKLVSGMKHLAILSKTADDFLNQARIVGGVKQIDVLIKLPEIIGDLIPIASKLIALYIDKPEPWVSENCTLAQKVGAIHKIFEVEDVKLIIKNAMGIRDYLSEPLPSIPEPASN